MASNNDGMPQNADEARHILQDAVMHPEKYPPATVDAARVLLLQEMNNPAADPPSVQQDTNIYAQSIGVQGTVDPLALKQQGPAALTSPATATATSTSTPAPAESPVPSPTVLASQPGNPASAANLKPTGPVSTVTPATPDATVNQFRDQQAAATNAAMVPSSTPPPTIPSPAPSPTSITGINPSPTPVSSGQNALGGGQSSQTPVSTSPLNDPSFNPGTRTNMETPGSRDPLMDPNNPIATDQGNQFSIPSNGNTPQDTPWGTAPWSGVWNSQDQGAMAGTNVQDPYWMNTALGGLGIDQNGAQGSMGVNRSLPQALPELWMLSNPTMAQNFDYTDLPQFTSDFMKNWTGSVDSGAQIIEPGKLYDNLFTPPQGSTQDAATGGYGVGNGQGFIGGSDKTPDSQINDVQTVLQGLAPIVGQQQYNNISGMIQQAGQSYTEAVASGKYDTSTFTFIDYLRSIGAEDWM